MFEWLEVFNNLQIDDLLSGVLGQLPENAQEVGADGVANGPEGGNGGEVPADDQQPAPGLFGGNTMMFLLPMMGVFVVYMLLMGRPQKKEQAKRQEMLDGLKKNDRVVTAGGIMGIVTNVQADNDFVTLRVDESANARIKILRTSIARVMGGEGDDAESDKKK